MGIQIKFNQYKLLLIMPSTLIRYFRQLILLTNNYFANEF